MFCKVQVDYNYTAIVICTIILVSVILIGGDIQGSIF